MVVRQKRLVLSKKCRVAVCVGRVSIMAKFPQGRSDLILLHAILQHHNSANPDVLLLMSLHHRDNLTPVSNV